jgi:hypothetical protein
MTQISAMATFGTCLGSMVNVVVHHLFRGLLKVRFADRHYNTADPQRSLHSGVYLSAVLLGLIRRLREPASRQGATNFSKVIESRANN